MLFETLDGDLIPISRIRKIVDGGLSGPEWIVQLDDDERVRIGFSVKTALENAPIASFGAAPGTQVLRVGHGQMFAYSVIGWVLPATGNPMPVTVDGVNDGSELDDYVNVLLPDGKVYRPGEQTYILDDFKRVHDVADAVIRIDEGTPSFGEFIAAAQSYKA